MSALADEEFYEGLLPRARKACINAGLTQEQEHAIENLLRLLIEHAMED